MARKKGNTGKRYTDAQKKRIVAFVTAQGRGGISKAMKKWGVSYIALARWMKGGPKKRGPKPGAKATRGLGKVGTRRVSQALSSMKVLEKEFRVVKKILKALAK